ncbi:MAG: substrate-binding domain-containing protein [Gemmatimonadetes bacterium]|nr:substrate-binding domain-containing protein [Gemmatimonadota bacterium]
MSRSTSRLIALTLATLAAACGGTKEQAGAGAAGGKTFTITLIAKSSTNPVFLSARTGAEAAAAELSKSLGTTIKIDWRTPPNEDATVQAQRIAEAVNDGTNALLISTSDAGKVTGAINEAVARGVPVMMFDSDAPDSKRFSFYGGDDAAIGRQVMDELATQMGGKGKVAILAGNQNAPNLQKRVAGVKEAAAKYPGISIVSTFYHAETPQDAAAEVLRAQNAYPEIQGWAMIGGWPLFTTSLLTDVDPKKVKIVSVDALPAELPYVEKGLAPVLLAQPVYDWGYVSVKTIVDHVLLKKDVPAHVNMELIRVSKDNLGTWARQLKQWGFTDIDPKYLALPK